MNDLSDVNAEPVQVLVEITLIYIEKSGIIFTKTISLEQRIIGFSSEIEEIACEFYFILNYTGGQRKLSVRSYTGGWNFVIEELNNATGEVERVLSTVPLSEQDYTETLKSIRALFSVDTLAAYDS